MGINVEGHNPTISIRAGFHTKHLLAADHFARLAGKIEDEHSFDDLSGEMRDVHLANVNAAVFFSVASLEASVNHLFADARQGNLKRFEGLHPDFPELLRQRWSDVKGPRILPKYEAALSAAGKRPLDRGKPLYQYTQYLVDLRNALVHFYPEWDTDQERHRNLKKKLRPRFPHSPFAAGGDEFFPYKCLGHGCAAWAVETAVTFTDEFFSRLGMESWVDGCRDRLNAEDD